jgi:hypothetical protein
MFWLAYLFTVIVEGTFCCDPKGSQESAPELRLGCELVIRTPSRPAIAARFTDKPPFRELLGNVGFRKLRRGLSGRES